MNTPCKHPKSRRRHTKNCPPGSWFIYSHTYRTIGGETITAHYLNFVCPCGCGMDGSIPIRAGQKEPGAWQWDGNHKVPTLNPSIYCAGQPCKWHGFFQYGKWNHCADSKLAPNCVARGVQV